MIAIGDTQVSLSDPVVLAIGAGVVLALIMLFLLIATVRRAGRAAEMMGPLSRSMDAMDRRVETLSDGQKALTGGLTAVSEAHASSQANMLKLMEQRLARAADLLLGTERSIDDIALACGFQQRAYFSRCFKRHFKQAPAAYRRHS